MRETTIRVSAKGGWDRVSTIGGWNSLLPSEDGKVLLTAPSEHRITFPLYQRRMEKGIFYWGMEHGFLSTITEWNRVSTPPWKSGPLNHRRIENGIPYNIRMGKVFALRSATGDWKDILGLGFHH
jgi:hypothetical protein